MTSKPSIFNASVITLFPEIFPANLAASLIGQGRKKNIWALDLIDLKQFAPSPPSHHIDGSPAGGGAGMVLRADIVAAAIDEAKKRQAKSPLIYLTPAGTPFTQQKARTLAQAEGVILLCGRFEGVDQRVLEARQVEEVSIGDFVLAGGEAAALVVLETIIRLLPDITGNPASVEEESFSQNLLEYPHYTAPAIWEGKAIPDILLSGNHQAIAKWRKSQAALRTAQRRPDLIKNSPSAKSML